jgi:hypothetical protein
MSLLAKIKGNIQETAASARGGVEDLQTKRELGQAYGELGRKAYGLINSGNLQAGELDDDVQRIRNLESELADENTETTTSAGTQEPGITGPDNASNRVGGPL